MPFLPAFARGALLLPACATLFIATSAIAATIDLYDVESATLGWAPATGPVVGYYVVVARNDEPPSVYSFASSAEATVNAELGDEVIVYVAAYDATGVAGPISPPSPTIRFNGAVSDPPPDDPPDDDPPPDDEPPSDPPPVAPGTALDFDGDGGSDLLVREATGEVTLWRMDGSKPIAVVALDYLPPSWQIVGNGDYDGNGVADVLWEEDGTGSLILWLLVDGAIAKGSILALPGLEAEHDWRVGGSGDFDGDGSDEVMLFSRVLGESELVYFAEGGAAERERLPGYTGAWSVEAIADVDGDGSDEIIWRDEQRHELLLWDLNGAGPAAPTLLAESMGDWRTVGSGDFDGDGHADLFVASGASGQARVWRFDETGVIAESVDLPAVDGTWTPGGVGDYDFDGLADAVWFDPQSGSVELWFSDGATISAETVANEGGSALELVSGNDGSDESVFRERLCDADFDGSGIVNIGDVSLVASCLGTEASGTCERADLDSDGMVSDTDFEIFRSLFGTRPCGQ